MIILFSETSCILGFLLFFFLLVIYELAHQIVLFIFTVLFMLIAFRSRNLFLIYNLFHLIFEKLCFCFISFLFILFTFISIHFLPTNLNYLYELFIWSLILDEMFESFKIYFLKDPFPNFLKLFFKNLLF